MCRKTIRRALFAGVAFVGAILLLGLLLETIGACWIWQRMTFNPLMGHARDNAIEREVPVDVRVPAHLFPPEYNTPEPVDATPAPGTDVRDMAIQQRLDEDWFRRFLELNEPDRQAVAVFQQMGVFGLRPDMTVGGAYGMLSSRLDAAYWIPSRKGLERSHVSASVKPFREALAGHPSFEMQEGSARCFLPAEDTPAHSGVRMYFFQQMPLMRNDVVSVPADSMWLIPFYQYKPNLRRDHHSTNQLGFRSPDVTVPKPAGVFRILCIGASTTEEGPEDNRTYPALLQQRLREAFPDRHIEVVNCGVSGMTLSTHAQRFGVYASLEPDLLLLYEGVNDVARQVPSLWLMREARVWQSLGWHSRFLRNFLADWFMPDLAVIRSLVREETFVTLDAFQRVASSFGVAMVMCSIAHPDMRNITKQEREMFDYLGRNPNNLANNMTGDRYCEAIDVFNEELRRWCGERHVPYVPVGENLTGGAGCFKDLCHMRPEAIERKAEIIAASLRDWLEHRFAQPPRK